MWKMVEKMYFENDATSRTGMTPDKINDVPFPMLFCLLFMAALTVVTGIYSTSIRLVVEKLVF